MAKHLKLTIKNTQIAEAINLGSLKDKLAKKKKSAEEEKELPDAPAKATKARKKETTPAEPVVKPAKEDAPRVRARSKSVFAEGGQPPKLPEEVVEEVQPVAEEEIESLRQQPPKRKSAEELRRQLFGEDIEETQPEPAPQPEIEPEQQAAPVVETPVQEEIKAEEPVAPPKKEERVFVEPPKFEKPHAHARPAAERPPHVKLGPTGRHIKDLLPPKRKPEDERGARPRTSDREISKDKPKPRARVEAPAPTVSEESGVRKGKSAPVKEFRDLKPAKRSDGQRTFDARDRQGLSAGDEDQRWRKRRAVKTRVQEEQSIVRPTSLKVRTPISIKDLAAEMKLKASQLIAKLFLQGLVVTLNDLLEDETTIQLLGHEFGCEITIDTSEEQRIRITDKSVREEISALSSEQLITRPPIVAFMGHVDHGKTSLIDAIRKSNRVSGEAGAITQHIGAFRCHTDVGDITILDTPGHEAFSAMRARGADVTDIVVLVVAGDEGIKQQTVEAIEHAKKANVTIVVAINKSDRPSYNPDNVYRQLAEQNLLPEVWGGQTLTVNCSAVTGAGVKELLETLALQAEVLELRADPATRARGVVLESELHKGLGSVATVIVQNGTLRLGDALVFGSHWGRVKTMRDEFGKDIEAATPSTPVAITGLSGVPDAGHEFIVVPNEREAREIAEARQQGSRQLLLQQRKKLTAENIVQQATPSVKKVLTVILRADVQGSLEALRVALLKIESAKAEVNIIFAGVGEISESDIQLAATSKAMILGFHTQIESHAENLMRQLNVQVKLHNIIYHAVDDVKAMMTNLLDKIPQETDRGKAEVKAIFKSSHTGLIAGCMVIDGTIHRSNHIRVIRNKETIGKAQIASLRRVKDDVREVAKGLECGIALNKFSDLQPGDILEAYEITYLTQEL